MCNCKEVLSQGSSPKEEEKEEYHMKSATARRFLPKGPPLLGEEKKEPHMKSIFIERKGRVSHEEC